MGKAVCLPHPPPNFLSPIPYFLIPSLHSLFPIPYSLFPTPYFLSLALILTLTNRSTDQPKRSACEPVRTRVRLQPSEETV